MEIIKNKLWLINAKPQVTIITPYYNRKNLIERTFRSVKSQTFRDFEYILIDDGSRSEERIDDYIDKWFREIDFPMMFVKKDNGGVHTARNIGIREARGEFILFLDSDDEIVPTALADFLSAWNCIPDKSNYREVVAQCVDENGKRVGKMFPDKINELSLAEATQACRNTKGEHVSLQLANVLKENLFPEYPGVTFVTENILWTKLEALGYRSWYINDMLRIYHTEETGDHLSGLDKNKPKKTMQNCINAYYESSIFINDWQYYKGLGYKFKIKTILRYDIMGRIVKKDFGCIKILRRSDRFWLWLFVFPSVILARVYKKKRMVTD